MLQTQKLQPDQPPGKSVFFKSKAIQQNHEPGAEQAPAAALADEALMGRIGEGCAESFAVMVERHSPALWRVALRMLGDRHDAEDVVQECFTRLWQQAPRWTSFGAGPVGWLHRTAVNLCFDRHRRLRLVTAVDELPEQEDESPLADSLIEASDTRRAVSCALAGLPERYRAALVLCYYEGLSNAAAAEALELNVKAMESLLFRARRRMRDLLGASGAAAIAALSINGECAA
jgi:RNA polymerase sigma factor (sigma-70 family)